jgi:hypothetical protein
MTNLWSWLADWLVAWNFALQVAALVLTAATIGIGGLTILAGKISGDRLDAKLAGANATAETAKTNTESLRNENLKLAIDLEAERIKRLEIERTIAPRDSFLTPERRRELVQVCANIGPEGVDLENLAATAESRDLQAALAEVFKEAGCLYVSHNPVDPPVTRNRGILVLHLPRLSGQGKQLYEALVAAGLPNVTLREADGFPEGKPYRAQVKIYEK